MHPIDKSVQLKPEEEVLEVVREDLVPHLPRFALLFLWFVIPFFFLFPLFRQGTPGVIFFLALVGSAALFSWRAYLRWTHTELILTDLRVIDVDRRGFFDCVVSETPYNHIDDVTYRVKGIVPTLFRYGDLRIHVAGSAADIEFLHAARPSRLQDLVNDLRTHVRASEVDRREAALKQLAKGMTMEEIQQVALTVRHRERDESLETLYADDDHA